MTVPQQLNDKAREALEAFREATVAHDPRADLLDAAKGA